MSLAIRQRLFGGVAAPDDLYAAIAERAEADAGLAALFGEAAELGPRVFVGRGGRDTPTPYVSLLPVGGEEFRNAGDAYFYREVIRATVFAEDWATVKKVAVRWGRVFRKDMTPLRLRDASFGAIATSQVRYIGEDDYQGRPLHSGYVEMTAITGRLVS